MRSRPQARMPHRCQLPRGDRRPFRAAFALIVAALVSGQAHAGGDLPEGATVVEGDVTLRSNETDLTVTQGTATGIIDWNSFNVGNGFGVHFDNGSGATLNRVTGLDASFIDGALTATGSLFLLNRNGIIIGENGRVLAGGDFVASTMDITNEDFLDGGGFTLFGTSNADVINLGQITSIGGDVLMAGYTVKNSGDIMAAGGRVDLAAGTRVDVLTDVSWMGGAYAVSLGERGNDVTNEGRIATMIAELRTHAGNIYALAGNNDGLIQATGVNDEGGRVFLTSDEGMVHSRGTIKAANGTDGGAIEIAAIDVQNFGGLQDVSGAQGGSISIDAITLTSDTEMRADGIAGAGGAITIETNGLTLLTSAGLMSADGSTTGGEVVFDVGEGSLIHSASITVDGGETGGHVALLGNDLALLGGKVSASGSSAGGAIHIGGGFQGGAIWGEATGPVDYANAQSVYVSDCSTLNADATAQGDGGSLVLWSDGITQFYGELTAREGEQGGSGGRIETSGLEGLGGNGVVDAGQGGEWLQDPRNIVIDEEVDAITTFQRLVNPNPGGAGGSVSDREGGDSSGLQFGLHLDIDDGTYAIGGYYYGIYGSGSTSYGADGAVYVFEDGLIAARLITPADSFSTTRHYLKEVEVQNDLVAFTTNEVDASDHRGALRIFAKGDRWQNGAANLLTTQYNPLPGADWLGYLTSYVYREGTAEESVHFLVADPYASTNGLSANGVVNSYQVFNDPNGTPSYYGTNGFSAGTRDNHYHGFYLAGLDDKVVIGAGDRSGDLWVGDSSSGLTLFSNVTSSVSSVGQPFAVTGSSSEGGKLVMLSGSQFYLFDLSFNGDGSPNTASQISTFSGTFSTATAAAFDGDTILIGDANANNEGGAAYFYVEPAGGWSSVNFTSGRAPDFTLNGNGNSQPSGYSSYNGRMGRAVAVDGDIALIGLPTWYGGVLNSSGPAPYATANGEVRTLVRGSDGSWAAGDLSYYRPAEAREPSVTHSTFGYAVAISGNTYAVSDYNVRVPEITTGGLSGSGSVYIYEDGALAARILTTDRIAEFGGLFGLELDLSGDTLATRGTNVFTLYQRGDGWRNYGGGVTDAYPDNFIASIYKTGVRDWDLDGDLLAFGIYDGHAEIYSNAGGSWSTTLAGTPSSLTLPSMATGEIMRTAVSGDTLALTTDDDEVFVFENLANDWSTATATQLFRSASDAEDGMDVAGFHWGYSIDLDGDTLVVGYNFGAPAGGFTVDRGVYIYERTTNWADVTAPTARLTAPGAGFGYLVAIDGDMIAVGEGWYSPGTGTNQGGDSVWVFERKSGWVDGAMNLVARLGTGDGVGLQYSLDIDNGNIIAGGEDLLGAFVAQNESAAVFSGPFAVDARATFGTDPGSDLNLNAQMIAGTLSAGTNITLQANNDISLLSPILAANPNGNGGNLSFEAGRSILINSGITTDGGNLTLLADHPDANATYRSSGEAVVVLGENVELNLGTGDLLIHAADRFENRTGDTSPFVFDAVDPGDFLIFAQTPDNTSAPDLANLGNALDIVGRDFLYYGLTFDFIDPTPASLPTGSGFIYAVQPTVSVGVGDSTITYGETPTAAVTLEGATLDGSAVDPAVFGITESDIVNLVDAGIADTVPTSSGGYANAGFYAGAVTAEAKASVTSGGLYGVAVSTGAAGDLTINKASIDATPDDATRQYRLNDPTFTLSYTGLLAGDSVDDIDTAPTVSSAAGALSDVGEYALTASGGSDNNYTINIVGNGTLTVTPQDVVISGLVVDDKVYDGTTAATFGGNLSVSTFGGDNVTLGGTLSATATFASANVGPSVPVTFSGFFLTGNAAKIGNYNLLSPTGHAAAITPFELTLSGLTANDRVYDGTTDATLSGTAQINPFGSDDVSLSGTAAASFADRHVGVDKPVTLSGLTLAGAAAGNYTLGTDLGLTAAITPLLVTVTGVSADNRTYDATTDATLSGSAVVGAIDGDEVAVTGLPTASFADKNAGADKAVTVDGYTLTGADAGNYTLEQPTGLTADIAPVDIVVGGVDAVDRTYDATLDIFLSGNPSVTPLGADDLAVTGTPVATLDDKNVGTDKAVTVSGYALAGADAANYNIVQPTDVTADVSARPITISGVTVDDKVYDGTTSATSSGSAVLGGILAGDDATLDGSGITFAFPDADVGVDKAVSLSGIQITGADAGNYTAAVAADFFASISPALLQLVGVTAIDRVYDSSTTVSLAGGALAGVIGDDEVSLVSDGASGRMAHKNAGTGKAVTVTGFTLTGAAAGNYTLMQPTGLLVDISAYTLTILGLSGDKTYDGTADAPLTFTGLDAVFDGDIVTLNDSAVTAAYADKNVGTGRTITLSGDFSLDGDDAGNYLLNQPGSLTGDIARLGITVTGLTIADKVYDGTTFGEISGTGSFGGAIAGDDLGIAVGEITITFADKNVGTDKPVALSGITLSGADAGNYTAESPQGITGNITAKTVTVGGLGADDKVYDRGTDATLTGTASVDGFVSGDDVALNDSAQAGHFDDKHVGADKTVTVSGLTLDGADAGNYIFVDPVTTASITPAEITLVGLTALSRVYDATTVATFGGEAALDFGVLTGVADAFEDVGLGGTPAGSFADKNVGEDKPVTVSAVSLTGVDAGNYSLVLPTLVADITPADLQITGTTVADKTYDATTGATVTSLGSLVPLGEDAVSLDSVTLAFDDKNAGQTKAVTATTAVISGADAGNYNVLLPTGITARITPADLALTGIAADSRIYDGTTIAPLSGSLQIAPIAGDAVSVAGRPSAHFTDANAGTGKGVTLAGLSLAGADAANYQLILPQLVADILVRAITVSGLFVPDKVYDGTTTATLDGEPVFANTVAGDDLAFDFSAVTAAFVDANAGANRAVTLTSSPLTGSDAANYMLTLPQGLTATILRKMLEVVAVNAVDRDYDGTLAVALSGGELSGVIDGDAVTLRTENATGVLADKNAAPAKPVTVAGYALGGDDAGNYTVAQPTDVTVDITPLELAVTGLEIADKFFDGTTTATASGGQLQGFISGDDVSLDRTNEAANFADPDVGEDKLVAVTGLTVGGADGGNYTLPDSLDVRGTILATLETITDVVPVEVLQATADAEREAARQQLEEVANATADTVELIDFEAANSQLLSGVAGAPLDQDVFSIPADQRDPTVDAYINAAYAADAAATAYNQQAEAMRTANREFKALTQDYNDAVRDAMVAEGLQETLQQELATIDNELATIDNNLSAIATAKQKIGEYQQRILEASRLGRGDEVKALQDMIAEAEAVVASENQVRAQREQLLAARAEGEQRLQDNAAVIARRDELEAQYDAAKTALDNQKTVVAAAKTKAEAAVAATEEARAAGEAKARELLAQAQRSREFWEGEATASLDATVDQVLAGFNADGLAPDGSSISDRFPLSADRQAELADRQAALNAPIQQYDALQSQESAARDKYESIDSDIRYVLESEVGRRGLGNATPEELAQLDPRDLGIPDETLLPYDSPAIDNLDTAADSLDGALKSVGNIKLMGGLAGEVALSVPANVASNSNRGLNDLDTPTTFDPAVEAGLKAEMQTFGLLPKFNNPALDQLPVATQLQLQAGMKQAAARQEQLIAAGMDPDQAAREAIDEKTMELVTMALFEKFDTYGIGDVPGVQAFVGEALGELSAQFGVSPGAMATNLVRGDFGGLMGDASDAIIQLDMKAVEVLTDPAGAGVQLAKDLGSAVTSGASAAFKAWTGGGGGSNAADEAAQRRAYEAYVAERTEALSTLGGALVQVENARAEALAAREAAYAEVGEAIVARAEADQARNARIALGSRSSLVAERDEGVAAARTNLQREEIADAVRPTVEAQQAREAQNIAQADALVKQQQALLNAFTENGGEG